MIKIQGEQFKTLIQERFKDMPKLLRQIKLSEKDLDTDLGVYRTIMQLIPYYCGRLDDASYSTKTYRKSTKQRINTLMTELNNPMVY